MSFDTQENCLFSWWFLKCAWFTACLCFSNSFNQTFRQECMQADYESICTLKGHNKLCTAFILEKKIMQPGLELEGSLKCFCGDSARFCWLKSAATAGATDALIYKCYFLFWIVSLKKTGKPTISANLVFHTWSLLVPVPPMKYAIPSLQLEGGNLWMSWTDATNAENSNSLIIV